MNKRKALLLGYILLGALCLAGCHNPGDTVTNSANTSVPPSLEETPMSDTTRLSQSEDSHQRIRAWVEDGNACLALDGIFWREYLGVEIAQDSYQVNGLDGACAGVYVDTLGWRIAPMVLFLMEDGTVEYLDVENVLLQSAEPAGTFTSMGALPGLSGIVDFIPGYSGDAETYDGVYAADNKTVFAIDRSGQEFDVFLAYAASETPVSSVPKTLPADLGGKTVYGYVLDLMKQYLPDNVFTNGSVGKQEKADARAAIALILQVCDEQLSQKQDQYWLHIRGRCYAQQFFDTKDAAYKELALADYQAALDMGHIAVKSDYDRIAAADDILFPPGWSMEQALTLEEMGVLLGIPDNELRFVENPKNYPPNGMPEVGYAIIDDPEAEKNQIIVAADVQGGKAMYEGRKAQAAGNKTEEIAGIGDAAFLCGFTDIDDAGTHYTALVLLRGDIVVQIWIPTEAWTNGPSNLQPDQLACIIGFQFVDNMTNAYRNLPEWTGIQ